MENLKKQYVRMRATDPKRFEKLALSRCKFLFTNYTNIFNRLFKDELNLVILSKFIDTLKLIENGTLDQHEASVKIGEVLKELYIDSALQREKKIDASIKDSKPKHKKPVNNVSWDSYKKHISA